MYGLTGRSRGFGFNTFAIEAAVKQAITAMNGAMIAGTIGLFFLLLRICLQRAASKKLEDVLGEGHEYEQKVVRPVAKAIAQRLKITGFMRGTTNHEMLAFKDAVRTLLEVLANHGVDLEFSKMSEIKRDNVINEIATQTREYFLPSGRDCCMKSCSSFVSFFKAEVTPHQIRDAATAIAEAVIQAQKRYKSSAGEMGLLSSSRRGMSSSASPMLPALELPELSSSKDILLRAPSSSQTPPASPSGVEPLRQERESAQVLGS